MVDALKQAYRDLVIANRVLAHQGVVDAYGHVSVRHPENPDHFLLSRSRSPELVTEADIMEFTLDGTVVGNDKRTPYLERFIHGCLYEAKPEVGAVVHSHAEETLAFGITGTPFKPVIHVAGTMGPEAPIWDIAEKFGDNTNLLVINNDHGRDLAARIGKGKVALMRGHGFAATGATVHEVVRTSIFIPVNARIITTALRMAPTYKALSAGEVEGRWALNPKAPETWRAWEYWARRAGVADLLGEGPT
jgi:ribulose-5-phosphate 4-epimerase/fuculose-1-phosphate aldolase